MIVVECYTDEFLVKLLGFRGIKHEGGKGKVLERVRENSDAIGIIDEDPGNNQPSERFEYIEYESRSTIKLLAKNIDRNKKVIEISPDLEGWILNRANQNRISPKRFDLPNDAHELHTPHIERRKNFREFMEELVKTDDTEIDTLKKWLAYTNRRFGLLRDLLYPAHLAVLQHYLYAMRMEGRAGEDRLHNSARPFAGTLVLFENDVHL